MANRKSTFLATTALGAAMFFNGAAARTNTGAAQEPPPAVSAAATMGVNVRDTTGLSGAPKLPTDAETLALASPETRQRARIRDALLHKAQDNFTIIAPTADTPYSHDLAALQDKVNKFMKTDPGVDNKAIIVDPARFDAAVAVGFERTEALQRVLASQGLTLDRNDGHDGVMLDLISGELNQRFDSRFGIHIYTQDGVQHPGTGVKTSVIVPSPDHAIEYPIAGLNTQEDAEFTNRHESWHAKDGRYKIHVSMEISNKIEAYSPVVLEKDAEVRQAYVVRHKAETFADVGAVGDMIRDGHNPDVLDHVRAWRFNSAADSRHLSVQALDGLKAEINKMGLDNFRKLDDHAAKEFYYSVVDKYAIDADALKAAAEYDLDAFLPEERKRLEEAAKTDPTVAKGIAYDKMADVPVPGPSANLLAESEKPVKAALDNWNAEQILIDRAFAASRKVTPETMVKAYGELQSELHAKYAANPSNHLYDLQMSKLQATFIDSVPQLDYAKINADRGVDIVAAEPALKNFLAPPKVAQSAKPAPRTSHAP